MRVYELDPTRGIAIRKRSETYVNNDRAIKTMVTQFDGIQNPTADQYINHLRAIQYRLASSQFDHWDD